MIWSWDDCISYLNAFPDLQRWYYQDVVKIRGFRDLDIMILQTIAMAFHRPAFEVPINCESPDEFLQALKDTQQAMRTGELVHRESRHVIRKAVGGWREMSNVAWREQLGEIDKRLRRLRSELTEGLKTETIRRANGFLDISDRALLQRLERTRASCLRRLNSLLIDADIPGS
jgi:hypothetical protein